MFKLTLEQEKKLLQDAYDADAFIDNGGGRMVFYLDRKDTDPLGLPTDKTYVLKVALGNGGLNQSLREIKIAKDYEGVKSLAKIYAYGEVCLIMEWVEVVNGDLMYEIRDFYEQEDTVDEAAAELIDRGYLDTEEEAIEFATKGYEAYDDVYDILGTEHPQFGRNSEGDLVLYDYGFESEDCCWDQVSDTREYVDRSDHRHFYLNLILETINSLGTEYTAFEFLDRVEEAFFDAENDADAWYDEDEEDLEL